MDWIVYWFMFPACIMIAAVATFSGISGAAIMTPFFILGFPLLGVPTLSTVAAIGASLFLETSGFGTGVFHYYRIGLADRVTARQLLLLTIPAAVGGAMLAHLAPVNGLRIIYGLAMLGVAWMLLKKDKPVAQRKADRPCPCTVCESECSAKEGCSAEQQRKIRTTAGASYEWCAYHLGTQKIMSAAGGFLAGLISTGVGEATLPTLVRRSRFPVPVAAATSTLVMAATVLFASLAHFIELAVHGGLGAIPWNLIVWGVPGAVIGASIGTSLQGKFGEKATRLFFGILFLIIGVIFLLAFTVFRRRLSGT